MSTVLTSCHSKTLILCWGLLHGAVLESVGDGCAVFHFNMPLSGFKGRHSAMEIQIAGTFDKRCFLSLQLRSSHLQRGPISQFPRGQAWAPGLGPGRAHRLLPLARGGKAYPGPLRAASASSQPSSPAPRDPPCSPMGFPHPELGRVWQEHKRLWEEELGMRFESRRTSTG